MGSEVEEVVTRLLRERVPDLVDASRVRLGEGLENVAFLVGGGLIVRVVKNEASRADAVDRDLRIFDISSRISSLAVPTILFADKETGVIAYKFLPGRPLLDFIDSASLSDLNGVAGELGMFLSGLHSSPVEQFKGAVQEDFDTPQVWLSETREIAHSVSSQIPEQHQASIRSFLDASGPTGDYCPVFSHNDLGIEHILVDTHDGELAVSGIIDWSDCAICDPAYDFGLIYRDLGPELFRVALDRYNSTTSIDTTFVERCQFYAKCAAIEDFTYGIERNLSQYSDKSLRAFAWLFPA